MPKHIANGPVNELVNELLIEKEFTRVFRANQSGPIALREARCLRVLFPALLPPIESGDAFAGRALRMEYCGVGFSPDVTLYSLPHGMGFFYRENVFEQALEQVEPDSAEAREICEMMEFWRGQNTTAQVKAHFTPRVREFLPSDSFAGDVGVGFPLYRMTGAYENYETLLTLGLPGLRARIEERRGQGDPDTFYEGLLLSVELLRDCCLAYADQANEFAKDADAARRAELSQMEADLRAVSDHPPKTLRQAIQLSWLYSCLAGVMDYGRMDVYLGDFLARDLERGVLTEEQALGCVVSLWRLMVARRTVYHGRVVIGGEGRRNAENADRFAMLAMEASRIVHDIEPQLTLRVCEGMNPRLMEKAMEVIGSGATYPMLYNDAVNVPAVVSAFGISKEIAQQYVPFGCGEYIIDHRGFGSPNGVINMLKALEVTLFNGQEIVKQQPMGLALGEFAAYKDFDAFYAAYKRQLTHYVEVLAEAEQIILERTAEQAPFLLMSLLYDGCIERGKALLDGGIDFLGATLESYGNINTIDSLAALREVVFERRLIAPQRLLEALRADFRGYEAERRLLLDAPKYGNDDPRVDALSRDLHDFEARLIRDQAKRVGLHSFLMVIINNSANTYLGRWTGASADGRKALTFMANANNPVGGMDRHGVTAMLNSLVSIPPEHHAGVVQNIKLSRGLFEKAPEKARALIEGYFGAGGTQAMITVLGRDDLEAALADPEQHQNLLVRVGGFSARFVTLEADVQQEVLSRTLH